ncbi:hypothetical protein BN80_104 [Yersinia phage phiR1-RT]|uniref:Uncharacterized protein n=1 Tax=Yersinia phage phiR1-RT TaxID=1206558 RepID=I7J3X4_BPPR1|nr:hypothetical protein BN80_104 [Yersinia phage phiR1-RT]CCI88678.1 hypothetical protein BN80_104 [Yersinia phage phiR1-RT]
MEIELIRSKTKLAQSHIKQMTLASNKTIFHANRFPSECVLGYVNNIKYGKYIETVIVIKGETDYHIIPICIPTVYESTEQYSDDTGYKIKPIWQIVQKMRGQSLRSKFETKEKASEYFMALKNIINIAKRTHIYL